MARRKKGVVTGKTWLIRAGIGIGAGILLGFIIGAVVVKVMQPPGVPDAVADASSTVKHPPVETGSSTEEPAPKTDDEGKTGTLVPKLIGMEEGDARSAIQRAGFNVGSVTFKASSAPLGTVVESIPIAGEAIVLPATVNLILSDGKGRIDSLPANFLR